VLVVRVVLVWLGTALGLVFGGWELFLAVTPTLPVNPLFRLLAGLMGGFLVYRLGGGVLRELKRAKTNRS
jgi:hypothetical protein